MTSPAYLEGSDISREHFALFTRNGVVYVQNLSTNGTLINGELAPQSKPRKLSEGDLIVVPGYEIEVEKHLPPALPKPDAVRVTRPACADVARSLTVWELIVMAAAIGTFILLIYYVIG